MQPVLRRTSKPVYPEDLDEGLARYSSAMQVRQLFHCLVKAAGGCILHSQRQRLSLHGSTLLWFVFVIIDVTAAFGCIRGQPT
jgi:hypothetical protein